MENYTGNAALYESGGGLKLLTGPPGCVHAGHRGLKVTKHPPGVDIALTRPCEGRARASGAGVGGRLQIGLKPKATVPCMNAGFYCNPCSARTVRMAALFSSLSIVLA